MSEELQSMVQIIELYGRGAGEKRACLEMWGK
jgi:hypothetical protein